jgi:alanyl-tRNA synthetase
MVSLDLTELMAREIGWTVDIEGLMPPSKNKNPVPALLLPLIPATGSTLKDDEHVEFTGYDETETIAHM